MSRTVSQLPMADAVDSNDWILLADADNPDTLKRVLASKLGAMTKTQITILKLMMKRGF